jgi:hypothetical protein
VAEALEERRLLPALAVADREDGRGWERTEERFDIIKRQARAPVVGVVVDEPHLHGTVAQVRGELLTVMRDLIAEELGPPVARHRATAFRSVRRRGHDSRGGVGVKGRRMPAAASRYGWRIP